MRKDLVQTSSIFGSKNKLEELDSEQVESDVAEEGGSEQEAPPPLYCRNIDFDERLGTGNIVIAHLFPDTMYGVIYDCHVEAYFACDFHNELIFDVPIYNYAVTAVAQDIVVLSIQLDYKSNTNEFTQMIIEDHDYTLKPKVDVMIAGEIVEIDGKPHSRLSTELLYRVEHDVLHMLQYADYSVFFEEDGFLSFSEKSNKKELLLSNRSGCYIGFYLESAHDEGILLHGRKYLMVNRLTIPLALVQDLETKELKLLTCKDQTLLEIEDFYDKDEPIEVINGVAMLTQETESGTLLNVFTPKHQRIVLEPNYKINTAIVENGLFFERDNVLLLSNGSLIFTSSPTPTTLTMRGKTFEIPCEYVGDL